MRLIDNAGLHAWCAPRSISRQGRKLKLCRCTCEFLVLELPKSADSLIYLASDLVALAGFAESAEDMLWISDWEKWNDWNCELGRHIVTLLRGAPLGDTSAHLIPFAERTSAAALILQVLTFRWDAWLASSAGSYLIECAHDGLIWIESGDRETQDWLKQGLKRWDPMIRPYKG